MPVWFNNAFPVFPLQTANLIELKYVYQYAKSVVGNWTLIENCYLQITVITALSYAKGSVTQDLFIILLSI